MELPTIASNPGVRSKMVTLLFLVAWLLGCGGLTKGFEHDADVQGACVFAIACGLWWISYKISLSANSRGTTLGAIALGIWMLNLTGMLVVDFHHSVTRFLFWACTGVFLILITAVAFRDKPSVWPET
jgi:hypothetical protein